MYPLLGQMLHFWTLPVSHPSWTALPPAWLPFSSVWMPPCNAGIASAESDNLFLLMAPCPSPELNNQSSGLPAPSRCVTLSIALIFLGTPCLRPGCPSHPHGCRLAMPASFNLKSTSPPCESPYFPPARSGIVLLGSQQPLPDSDLS